MAYADSALRVVVSGIRKGPVKRYDKGIVEEDNLGYFFHDRGCRVESVRLVIDSKRGDASRGFGFVDFEDQQSFQKALDLNGERVPDIAGKDGCLHIEAARPATEETRKKQQELLKARHATEEMERELRFREARVTELMREVKRKRERQNVTGLAAQLEDEAKRQDAIRKAQESLRAAEETLHRAIEVEDERTKAMEAIACSVDGEQTRPHHEAAKKTEEADSNFQFHPEGRTGGEVPGEHHAEDVTSTTEELQVRVRNTFLEYYVPASQLESGLVRTKTAPPEFLSPPPTSPQGQESSPGGTEAQIALGAVPGSLAPLRTPGQPDLGAFSGAPAAEEPDKAPGGALQRPRWSTLMDEDDSPVRAPWVLRRDVSAAELSRAILEEKMSTAGPDAAAPPASQAKGKAQIPAHSAAESKLGKPVEAALATSTPDSPTAPAPVASTERRHVRLRNVPALPAGELKGLLAEELSRLWRAVRGRAPPLIDEFRIPEKPGGSKTFAQVAGAGIEVEIVFADADDAAWLVDGREAAAWSRATTLSLRGRMLQVEWVFPAPVDWRKLRYTAETDASSHISYGTLGTRQSFSSKIGERAGGARGGCASATGPARNRTVVLEGLPKNWPVHQVRDEVLSLIKKLWLRDGLKFDPREQLHQGGDGGISVRAGRTRNEENGGTCLVRLRSHLDAKWLVESTGGRFTVGGGTSLRVSWARPREGR